MAKFYSLRLRLMWFVKTIHSYVLTTVWFIVCSISYLLQYVDTLFADIAFGNRTVSEAIGESRQCRRYRFAP